MDYMELTRVHKLYGFILSRETDEYLVYTQLIGFFRLAIIVAKKAGFDCQKIKHDFEDIGYSCMVKRYTSLEDAQTELYRNYFRIEESRERVKNEYVQFCAAQSRRLASDYSYVNSGLCIDGVAHELGIDVICDIIEKQNNDPQLIIIEAAAGFGKTCTANEVLNMICTRNNDMVPIYIELSKNRTASIFRYILLDEIDRKFSFMNTEVVQEEIARGFVPLVIDGFDELISRAMKVLQETNEDIIPQFEDAETMLDTIADLLKHNAKVIITARKSSIFYGENFENWVDSHSESFNVIRVVINEPDISDWISQEKRQIIEANGIPLQQIANPVLLAYLRNCSEEQLRQECVSADSIVDHYFRILLDREQGRQNIALRPDEQYMLFAKLAGTMMGLDISICSREEIKELILLNDEGYLARIIDERYLNTAEKPTVNDFAMTLAGHALLDRHNSNRNYIGFINEFVFGDLLAYYMCENEDAGGMSAYYITLAATAYSSRQESKRMMLFNAMQKHLTSLNLSERWSIDILLPQKTTMDYVSFTFSDIYLQTTFTFSREYHFSNCQFKNCVFRNVTIYSDTFQNCTFIECKFTNCSFVQVSTDGITNFFYGCIGENDFVALYDVMQIAIDPTVDYRKQILEQYWPKGRSSCQTRCTYRTLICGFAPNEYRQVDDCIQGLKHDGYISKAGQYYYLNMDKMSEIRAILRR